LGLLDTVRPILGYIIAIAVILLLATLGFMAVVSAAVVSSATAMAEILVLSNLVLIIFGINRTLSRNCSGIQSC